MNFLKILDCCALLFLLISAAQAYEYETSTFMDVTGMVDDESSNSWHYEYDYYYLPDYDDISTIQEETRTSGGDFSLNKNNYQYGAEKLMSYNPIESGHLSTSSINFESYNQPWWKTESRAQGSVELSGPAAIESKLYGYNPFFRYTVGPNKNSSIPYAIGSVEMRYSEQLEEYDYTFNWDPSYERLNLTDQIIRYHKEIEDSTAVSGNISKLTKAYSTEYYRDPRTFGLLFGYLYD